MVRVSANTKDRAGPLLLAFDLTTDRPTQPNIRLSFSAFLVAQLSITEVEPVSLVKVGDPLRRRLLVTSRSIDDRPPPFPSPVVPAGIEAAYTTMPTTPMIATDGSYETTRELLIETSPSREPGRKTFSIVLRWPDGREFSHPIHWEVLPDPRVEPSCVVVRADERTARRSVVVAAGAAFRVIEVTGAGLSDFTIDSNHSSTRHVLKLSLDRANLKAMRSSIRVLTDHPERPEIEIPVFNLRAGSPAP